MKNKSPLVRAMEKIPTRVMADLWKEVAGTLPVIGESPNYAFEIGMLVERITGLPENEYKILSELCVLSTEIQASVKLADLKEQCPKIERHALVVHLNRLKAKHLVYHLNRGYWMPHRFVFQAMIIVNQTTATEKVKGA